MERDDTSIPQGFQTMTPREKNMSKKKVSGAVGSWLRAADQNTERNITSCACISNLICC